ncbi:MAG: hypothetical protein M1833_002625 [Piccolia ochrophora]|nr:MAG: hypothetical protein M1833_002625 [Piccolia ochrophora]
MPIAVLPENAVRQLGSSQVLTNPVSAVKELIDNALDAHATSVFVEIFANTVDIIQVKDNGQGVPEEDADSIAKRHCTSKIRDMAELRVLGGRTLGFRGDALASAAGMSEELWITTRVDGEPVARKWAISQAGTADRTERASHPVGTTIRLKGFLKLLPVRREAALKCSAKSLGQIKDIMQAYVLARPAIRFSLKVLKLKNDKFSWTYVPNNAGEVADAAMKVIGREAAVQCTAHCHIAALNDARDEDIERVVGDSSTPVNTCSDFRIEAFIPKPDADPTKIANKGQFISIDSRPISCVRGFAKEVAMLFKQYARSALSIAAGQQLKNPFMFLNVICPTGSYDPNVEPAKDDVLFADRVKVLKLVEVFFEKVYGSLKVEPKLPERDSHGARSRVNGFELLLARRRPSTDVPPQQHDTEDYLTGLPNNQSTLTVDINPQLRSRTFSSNSLVEQHRNGSDGIHREGDENARREIMYESDEEDLENPQVGLRRTQWSPSNNVDEEGPTDASLLNPWTIAKLNAPVRLLPASNGTTPNRTILDHHLPTPTSNTKRLHRAAADLFRDGEESLFTTPPSSPPPAQHRSSSPHFQDQALRSENSIRPGDQSLEESAERQHVLDRWLQPGTPTHYASPQRSAAVQNTNSSSPHLTQPRPIPETDPFTSPLFIRGNPSPLAQTKLPGPAFPRRLGLPRAHPLTTLRTPFKPPLLKKSHPDSTRAVTVRDAIAATAPLPFPSDDEDSIVSSSPTFPIHHARPQARPLSPSAPSGSTSMDTDPAMDYEHRKRAAIKHLRAQRALQTTTTTATDPPSPNPTPQTPPPPHQRPSPHKNRYNAALATLRTAPTRPSPPPIHNIALAIPFPTPRTLERAFRLAAHTDDYIRSGGIDAAFRAVDARDLEERVRALVERGFRGEEVVGDGGGGVEVYVCKALEAFEGGGGLGGLG